MRHWTRRFVWRKPRGTCTCSACRRGSIRVPFDLGTYFLKRLDVRTIFGAQDEPGLVSFRQALRLIAEGEIDMSPYVTHTLPLERVRDAFALAHEPSAAAH